MQNNIIKSRYSISKLFQYNLSASDTKIVTLAALGGMLEFYDFIIYGLFSVYFADQFFANSNEMLSIIESYIVFLLGYIARPFGGIIFSYIGDEYGRKRVLVITIVLMGVSSLGIGLLPTYRQIGIFAPILLLLFRLIQGLALGGELPSTYVYIFESLPNKLGSGFGITMAGINAGLLLGTLINQFLNVLYNHQEIVSYAWRLPFIFGGIICIVSYKIRSTLQETKEFIQIIDKPKVPIFYLLRHYLLEVLSGVAITAILASMVIIAIIFMPTYLGKIVKLDQHVISYIMMLAMIANIITIPIFGGLCNINNPRKIFLWLICISIPIVAVCYYLICKQIYLYLALVLLSIIEAGSVLLVPLLITMLFPTKVRLTGVAFCYNLGFSIFAGLAPIIITKLIDLKFNKFATPVLYLWVIFIISLFGLLLFNNLKNNQTQLQK